MHMLVKESGMAWSVRRKSTFFLAPCSWYYYNNKQSSWGNSVGKLQKKITKYTARTAKLEND